LDDLETALAETTALMGKTQVGKPAPVVRQKSAGCIEDLLQRGRSGSSSSAALLESRERSQSFEGFDEMITTFRQPPMRFRNNLPEHLRETKHMIRSKSHAQFESNNRNNVSAWQDAGNDEQKMREESKESEAQAEQVKAAEDEAEKERERARRQTLEKDLQPGGKSLLLDTTPRIRPQTAFSRRDLGQNRQRPVSAGARPSKHTKKVIDKELLIFEGARLKRLPSYRLFEHSGSGKAKLVSEVCHAHMSECEAVLRRFESKKLDINADAVKKAILVPSDLPEHFCLKNLPRPGSALRENPALSEKPDSKHVAGARRRGAGKRVKKGGSKKKKK
jgi:hypothetical protein